MQPGLKIVTRSKLFSPMLAIPLLLWSLIGLESTGIGEMTYNSIMMCNIDERTTHFGNIVLAGGTTLLPGFAERMRKEIAEFAPASMKINVAPATPESVWEGGDKLGENPYFAQMLFTREEYERHGPRYVHRKCL